jgi:hypothetical protein
MKNTQGKQERICLFTSDDVSKSGLTSSDRMAHGMEEMLHHPQAGTRDAL